MFRIRFTNSAETDLLELWLNIAEENITAADETLDVIQEAVSLLAAQPEMGRARPELAGGLRSIPTRTPYARGCRLSCILIKQLKLAGAGHARELLDRGHGPLLQVPVQKFFGRVPGYKFYRQMAHPKGELHRGRKNQSSRPLVRSNPNSRTS